MFNKGKKENISKSKVKLISICLMVLIFNVSLVGIKPAQAFLGFGDINITGLDIPRIIEQVVSKGLTTAANVFFGNQLARFTQQFAYNSAVKLAGGQPGQTPSFWKGAKEALKAGADQASGEFAQEIFKATANGKCELSKKSCLKSVDCGIVAEDTSPSCNGQLKCIPIPVLTDEYKKQLQGEKHWKFRRERCESDPDGGFLGLGGVNICSPINHSITLKIKTAGLNFNTFNPGRPALNCSFQKLKDSIGGIRDIDSESLINFDHVISTSDSNQILAVLNIGNRYLSARITGSNEKETEYKTTKGVKCTPEGPASDKCKTPSFLVEATFKEGIVKFPMEEIKKQTGDIVVDALGAFASTYLSKSLDNVFEKGFDNKNNLFGGFSGVTAARQKFANLLEPSSMSQGGSLRILQELSTGCDVLSNSVGGGSSYNAEALRQINNCVIDLQLFDAIDRKLTVKDAIKAGLLDGNRLIGTREGGLSSNALAGGQGANCDGCDPGLYSLRSIIIMRKYRILPVGWELAAKYIKDVHQVRNTNPSAPQTFTLNSIIEDYLNPRSPFYRLIDPDWQLKAPATLAWRQGPGESKPLDVTSSVDSDGDGKIDEDEFIRTISRIAYTADERSCVFENEDGTCRYFGYCTEEKPIWRPSGETCDARYETCQTYEKAIDSSGYSYQERTVDTASCNTFNAGCRRFAAITYLTGEWIDTANDLSEYEVGQDIYLDYDAPFCTSKASGCSEFLRLTRQNRNIFSAGEILDVIGAIPNEGTSADYQNFALVDQIYLSGERISCIGEDTDNNNILSLEEASANVACRMYSPDSFGGSKIPGVVTLADMDTNEFGEDFVSDWGDECPAECVGYQSYEEIALEPLYPDSFDLSFIASTAIQCRASSEGCTEFTNLNEVVEGGEGLEYYTHIRECVTEDDSSQETFFTWEGSEDTGFQLRTWQLVATDEGSPIHSGDSDYDLCNASIFNLPPGDPLANPDCREYLSGDLGSENITRFYRLHSRVIFVSAECRPLRRSNITDETECRLAGGDPQANGCIYMTIPERSRVCRAQEVDCRLYRSGSSGNSRQIINSSFEGGISNFQGWSQNPPEGMLITEESVLLEGHSLSVQGSSEVSKEAKVSKEKSYVLTVWAKGRGVLNMRIEGSGNSTPLTSATNPLSVEWGLYRVGPVFVDFVPGGDERLVISGWEDAGFSDEHNIDNIILTETSDQYLINKSWTTPLSCDLDIDGDSTDPLPHGGESNEPQLYCEAYKDSRKKDVFIKSFTKLCSEEFVGCEALIETHNSSLVGEVSEPEGGQVPDIFREPDEIAYVVNDPNKYCNSTEAGCTALGLAFVDRDLETTFSNTYRIIDPDDFVSKEEDLNILCRPEDNLCEEYFADGQDNAPNYFVDPQDRVCEFKRNILIVDGGVSTVIKEGWFRQGADPINAVDVCQVGDGFPIRFNNDEGTPTVCNFDYELSEFVSDSVGDDIDNSGCYSYSCPSGDSSCTAFQDPLSSEGCDINLLPGQGRCSDDATNICRFDSNCVSPSAECQEVKSCDYFYFIKDSLQDGVEKCSGGINPSIGCVPFWDLSNEDRFLVGDCQPGCSYEFDINGEGETEPRLVNESCETAPYDPYAKPGCLNQ